MAELIENQSRLVRKPIPLGKVAVSQSGRTWQFKGSKGDASFAVPEGVQVEHHADDASLDIKALVGHEGAKALSGTVAACIRNIIHGLTDGFEKTLELKGVGYRAKLQGARLVLTLGKSHEDVVDAPAGITFTVPSNTEIVVSGSCKQLVGQVAANIRSLRPPEPYKGKGIRYKGESIQMKEVKKKSS